MQFLIFRRMEGQDLRQTLVTLGLSIIFSDLMVWVWGGNAIQIDTPDYLAGPVPTPIVVALKSSGEAVFLQYPRVRLVIFAAAVLIGIAMWLALHRTRIGVMIRAGVDDRDMLSVLGYRVQLLFVAGVRLRRWTCRNGRNRRRHLSVDLAGRGFAIFCWPRWWWSLSAAWDRFRARRLAPSSSDLSEQFGTGLFPELRDRPELPDHGHRARHSPARAPGEALNGVGADHGDPTRHRRAARVRAVDREPRAES